MKSSIRSTTFWMQALLIASSSVLLCSCRGAVDGARMGGTSYGAAMQEGMPTDFGPGMAAGGMATSGMAPGGMLPPTAYTGHSEDGYTTPGALPGYVDTGEPVVPVAGPPLPATMIAPWRPPGIKGPWPQDEFLFDGGDHGGKVIVRDDWRVDGLDLEDTVAHYDTLDGRTIVTPSNRVCLYAPRFAAVRKVDGLFEDEQLAKVGGVLQPIAIVRMDEANRVNTALQPIQVLADTAGRPPVVARINEFPTYDKIALLPFSFTGRLKAYEDFSIIRIGVMEESEKPFIAKSVEAAIQWTHNQAVQVIIDGKAAHEDTGTKKLQSVYRVDLPDNPKLRVCKVASTPTARPGEIVEFTLRFDNIGDQTIGNVTLVDNLTTRLEYVPNTARSSVEANFSVEPNQGNSLILRWEIVKPLAPGEGGLVRFDCRVR
ncbi:MAG: DUF11 domain-containing protein [Planctomycetota bacterium]|nr:DUF11 domain-containing protein [Planctomycetota bacterium]